MMTGAVQFFLTDDLAKIEITKFATRNGERVRIRSPKSGDALEFDALALEALSWQTSDSILSWGAGPMTSNLGNGQVQVEVEFAVVNEFAAVKVRKLQADGRELLSVQSPLEGHSIILDVPTLLGLCKQPTEIISQWLETPWGPEEKK